MCVVGLEEKQKDKTKKIRRVFGGVEEKRVLERIYIEGERMADIVKKSIWFNVGMEEGKVYMHA